MNSEATIAAPGTAKGVTTQMKHFRFYRKQDILSLTNVRRFETKLGERVKFVPEAGAFEELLATSPARFVILGIPEDIGIRANHGISGADSAWLPFLQAFLNIQSNDFLSGDDLLLTGHFDFGDMQYLIERTAHGADEKLEAYRHAVNTIDDEVEKLVKTITEYKKIPIVIGGGHNNAYPIIKGSAKGWHKAGSIPLAQLNCINLDAHADYRPLEGRHSGNAFRYAEEDGYLQKYFIVGLHENYLPQNIWIDIVNNPFIDCITFEDMFIHEKRTFMQAVAHAIAYTEDTLCGIELDIDSIQNALCSAATPVGISQVQARQYLSFTAADTKPAYLHICEGAARLADGRTNESTGKLLSYLVSDFVKAVQ
jgi:formiminoglutamase